MDCVSALLLTRGLTFVAIHLLNVGTGVFTWI